MPESVQISVLKAVTQAVAGSTNMEIMASQMTQLLVGHMGIKGCRIFAMNAATDELESLASCGLSIGYLNKGPVFSEQSIRETRQGKTIVIADVAATDQLQYPENARAEGIRAIVSIPLLVYGKVIGEMRLFHSQIWSPTAQDLEILALLGDYIGLALLYLRLFNALEVISETVRDVHAVWMGPRRGQVGG